MPMDRRGRRKCGESAIDTNVFVYLQVNDKALLSSISRRFMIHPLVILDVETAEQRTKLDVFDDAFFLVMKLIHPDRDTQQISFYLKENVLITFQTHPHTIFEHVKSKRSQSFVPTAGNRSSLFRSCPG